MGETRFSPTILFLAPPYLPNLPSGTRPRETNPAPAAVFPVAWEGALRVGFLPPEERHVGPYATSGSINP